MADQQPEKRKSRISEEKRQKLSELAKQRHAEGKLGGVKFGKMGGRPKGTSRDRIAKRVAEAAMEEKNARQIIEVFKDAIHESQPMQVRLKGAQAWVELANTHAKMELQEEASDAIQHDREELLAILSKKLTAGPTSQILRSKMIESETGIVDAEVVDAD